jgi:restriction endonuclease S subunit
MAVWSIVPFSLANQERRFGAEFWMPEYLEPLRQNKNWVPIGDLVTSCQYGISREMNEEGVGVPIYRMNEMDDLFLSAPAKSVMLSDSEYSEFRLSVGDVLFNRTNSFKYVGRTGILKEPVHAVFASYLIRLVPDTSRLLPEYLTVYLNCPTGIAQVKRRAMESINQANVSGSEIKKVPIPLFPISFQRQIVSLLDQAAESRQEAKRSYHEAERILLDGLALSELDLTYSPFYVRTYSDAFAARRLDAEHFQPKYYRVDSAINSLKYPTVALGELIGQIRNGFDYREFVEEGTPYIRVGDIQNGRIDLKNSEKIALSVADVKKDITLHPGDILFTRKGSFGNAAVVRPGQESAIISSEIMLLRIKNKEILPEYLAVYLNSPLGYQQVERRAHGVAFYSISQPDLATVSVVCAPLHLQKKIESKVLEAHKALDKSNDLLIKAKQAVEKMILGRT